MSSLFSQVTKEMLMIHNGAGFLGNSYATEV